MGATLSVYTHLIYKTTTCIKCGVEICLPESFYDKRVKDQHSFYCPNGHSQHFIGETEEEKLKKELDAQKRRTEMALADARCETARRERAEKKLKRAERRVHNGVCPHCSRTFTNLARHMQTKHGTDESAAQVKAECVAEKQQNEGG